MAKDIILLVLLGFSVVSCSEDKSGDMDEILSIAREHHFWEKGQWQNGTDTCW